MSAPELPNTQVHSVRGLKKTLLMILGKTVNVWQRSLRYEYKLLVDPDQIRQDTGGLILLWHNRLFPGIGALRKSILGRQKLYGLVSASRDGAQLSVFLKGQGIEAIRGSSSRRGFSATRELLKVLQAGDNVAITVDGPRGPCYEAQAGAALLMQVTGAPAYIIGAECESCFTLKSWDRFIVPMPFSRVKITLDRFAPVTTGGKEERKAIQERIKGKLLGLTHDSHLKNP